MGFLFNLQAKPSEFWIGPINTDLLTLATNQKTEQVTQEGILARLSSKETLESPEVTWPSKQEHRVAW